MTSPKPTSVLRVVDRLLDHPELGAIVGRLESPAIRSLVEHLGLEDAGEIVGWLSPTQLEKVFDDDLWQSARPGEDETFDAGRFALWLEVLLQAGEARAIATVAELDEDLVALGLSSVVLVIDIDAMTAEMSNDDSDETRQLDKALENQLYEELEEFRIIAREALRWDAILTLLVGLDRDHHSLLRRLLERCAAISQEYIEENGDLYDVLTSSETLAADVAGDRMTRREGEGHVAASDALAFFRLTVTTPLEALLSEHEPDVVSRMHAARSAAARSEQGPERIDVHLEEMAFLVNAIVASAGGPRRISPTEATRVALAIASAGLELVASSSRSASENPLRGHGPIHAFRLGLRRTTTDDRWSADRWKIIAEEARWLAAPRLAISPGKPVSKKGAASSASRLKG